MDDLKDVCEETLLCKVDSDCCFALLALADQFQVRTSTFLALTEKLWKYSLFVCYLLPGWEAAESLF